MSLMTCKSKENIHYDEISIEPENLISNPHSHCFEKPMELRLEIIVHENCFYQN